MFRSSVLSAFCLLAAGLTFGVTSFAATDLPPLPAAAKVSTVTEVVASKKLKPMFSEKSAAELEAIADRYRKVISEGGFPKVRGSGKKGTKGKNIIALNQRLFMDGYLRVEATQGEYADIFTSATEDAVRRFQRNMGLAASGKLDQTTLAYLNVPAEQRLRTIEANVERLRVYGQNLGTRYVIVNIPAQQIETVGNGRIFSRHNAIVGRPDRPSPVVMTALKDINFNPYWNAPVSIVERDILPKLRSGTRILEDMNIRVFKGFGGPEVDPRSVDWRRVIPDSYHFRQEPGEGNAMATAKINFPSPFGIYLHDTPERKLFGASARFFSSGCVRVDNVSVFLQWVLDGQDSIGEAEIASLAETLERKDVQLVEPPQLRVVYLTAWPVGNTVAFRHDIYELDGTGFTVGQPMPVGELSPDGERFVLKPLPRLISTIDDSNSGFSLFGKRKPRLKNGKPIADDGDDQKPKTVFTSKVTDKSKKDDDKPLLASSKKPLKPKTVKGNKGKDVPGLFDWAAWRKEQAALAKADKTKKRSVKKVAKKPDDKAAKKVVVAKVDPKKKPIDKALAAKKPDDKTLDDKKVVIKKADDKAPKVDPKKIDCKPGADGKPPKGCKTAEIKKPLKKPKLEAAAN